MNDSNNVLMHELQLVKMAQRDKSVMNSLLKRLQPHICKVARSMTKTLDQAEEIEQAAMLEMLRSLGKYKATGPLESWAGAVTYRTGATMLKRIWRWQKLHLPLEKSYGQSAVDNPDRTVRKWELYTALSTQMESIPEERRTAFILHIIYEYSVKEVSTIMNISENTTKYRLKTAIKEIRALFDANPALLEATSEVDV